MRHYLYLILVIFAACKPKPFPSEQINKFNDEKIQKIYELQDQRNSKALIPFLKAKLEEHRTQAALAFASIHDTAVIPHLVQMLLIDQKEMPRRAAALALGQIGHPKVSLQLRQAFASETSVENQKIILEAIGRCIDSTSMVFLQQYDPQELTLKQGWAYAVFHALRKKFGDHAGISSRLRSYVTDADEELAIISAHYLSLFHRVDKEASRTYLEELFEDIKSEEAQHVIELIFQPNLPDLQAFSATWFDDFRNEKNSFKQVMAIRSIDPQNEEARHLLSVILDDTVSAYSVKNEALTKIIEIEKNGSYYPEFFAYEIERALLSGDMALQSIACYALTDKELPHAWDNISIEILEALKNELVLPRQIETYRDLSKAIDHKKGTTTADRVPEYNRPIDWGYVKTIKKDQKVEIITNKGPIVIVCFVEDAPGSVCNFLKLVDSSFYNGKLFHRVVPDFVIQGGCPRGDGWGSLDWSQRSEFSNYQRYTEGTVGLASSGMDTEGVQWFITHQSTPYLTGRYTIFARVEEGMETVNSIELGDTIVSVRRI